ALGGSVQVLWSCAQRPVVRAAAAIGLCAATVPLCGLARHMAADFLPCAPPVVEADNAARTYWVVPAEIKAWLSDKAAGCNLGRQPSGLTTLDRVSWGLYDEQRDGDMSYRWSADVAVFILRETATAMVLALRRPDASAERPVRV